jgi:sugar lactone lactonase YvrE
MNTRWTQHGTTVAGGNGGGTRLNQLNGPYGLYIDDDQTIYVVDYANHRVVEWKSGATSGQVVAGGKGQGNQANQLNSPTAVIVDKETDSLIICDFGNRRVVRWPRRNSTSGETIISGIASYGLTMDSDGYLYVCDWNKHEVKRWKIGETNVLVTHRHS